MIYAENERDYMTDKQLEAMDCCSRDPMEILYEDVNGEPKEEDK